MFPLDEMQSTNIADQVKGRFVGPGRGASTLDYGLVHGSLHLDMMVAWNVPFRPHALVSTTLDVGDMANIYPQPTSFPDLGGVEVGHSPTKVCSVCIQDTIGSEPTDLLFGQVFSDIESPP